MEATGIINDSYFLTVLRYIHQNLVKAGIMRNIKEYKWSSYNEYIGESKIIDKEYVLKMFHENNNTAIKVFIKFNNEYNDDKCLEIEEKKRRMTDQELREIIKEQFGMEAFMIKNESKEKMKAILRKILKIEGASTRQLSRVTGISSNIIWKL